MHYHFIGIKGSGMASLARIVYDKHHEVTGSDIEKYIFTQAPLEQRGIKITNFDANNIQEGMVVIVGNAFDMSNVEVKKAYELASSSKIEVYRYHEFLGRFIQDYKSISIAGTHGKTTTTGIVAHLMDAVEPTGYLIGDGSGEISDDSSCFVLESCEYKRHFMAYKPDYAIITNIELDHVDYYKDMNDYISAFESFANQVQKGVVLFGDDENIRRMKVQVDALYYGLNDGNDVQAKNVVQDNAGMRYDVYYHGEYFAHFDFPFVGMPLLWNTLGVIALGIMQGISADIMQKEIASFPGVARRFTTEVNKDNIYIDDYAHHPTAVKYMIEAARVKYPNKKIIAIFKPDRYSRVHEFMQRFADELSKADEAYLCNFPENADKEGFTFTMDDVCKLMDKGQVILEDEDAAKFLASRGPAVYLFMSSKDIYKLKDLVKNFQ